MNVALTSAYASGVLKGAGITIEGAHTTGEQLWDEILRIASCVQEFGVNKGDRILISGETDYRTITSFLGAVMAGAAPCLVAPPMFSARASERHLAAAVSVCEPKLAISWDEMFDGEDLEVVNYGAALRRVPLDPQPVDGEATHHIQLTSGSTSRPKGVVLTHTNVKNNFQALSVASNANFSTRIASWLPLYHDMGLIQVLAGLQYGYPITLMRPTSYLRRPLEWIRLLSEEKITHTAAPPFSLRACAKAARAKGIPQDIDLSNLRQLYIGAEPIPSQFLVEFAETFAPAGLNQAALTPSYGLAEAVLAVTVTTPQKSRDHGDRNWSIKIPDQDEQTGSGVDRRDVVSCGRPVEGMEVRITNADGCDAGEDKIGKIFVRGTSVSPQYLGDEVRRGPNDWIETGDLGFLHEKELYVTGREKEIVIIRGRNYMPYDIEEVIETNEHVGVGHCIVTNASQPSGEEILVAVIDSRIPAEESGELVAEIIRLVRAALGLELQYVHVLPRGQLPKTTSGKRQRLLVRKLIERAMTGSI